VSVILNSIRILSIYGEMGKLVDVLRATNTIDDHPVVPGSIVGGHDYTGAERSDVHGAIVVAR